MVDVGAPRDVARGEAEPRSARGERGRSRPDAERVIDEDRHAGDRLPHGRRTERVQREIAGYAHLSHAAMKSTRIIAENLAQWKSAAENFRQT